MSKHHSHSGGQEGGSAQSSTNPENSSGEQPSSNTASSVPPDTAADTGSCEAEGGTAENAFGGTACEQNSPENKIAELEAQLADAKDQFLRKAADFENFRKRMNQEKQNAIDFANQSLLLDLIPVIDDFDRAIQAATTVATDASAGTTPAGNTAAAGSAGESSSQSAPDSLLEGINMIEKRLISQLESKWGLKRFDSAGEPFDPNRHEALMMEKSAEITEPVVKEDLLKGYMLKDRVIRSAKVKVLMPEASSAG